MEWKPVPGWETLYSVSSNGLVRREDSVVDRSGHPLRILGRILKPAKNKKGYQQVTMKNEGECLTRKVHTLVLMAFVGPRNEGQQARHLDGNKDNNSIGNLVWGTAKENSADKIRLGEMSHPSKWRTHCIRGHELSGDNIKMRISKGYATRRCIECSRSTHRLKENGK